MLEKDVQILKRLLTEQDRPMTINEMSEVLGRSYAQIYNILLYMGAVDIVDRVKRGKRHFYYLKGAYDENRLAAMLPRPGPTRRPRRRAKPSKSSEHVSPPEAPAVGHPKPPSNMLPALAVIGLYKEKKAKRERRPEPKPVREPSTPIFLTVERRGRVRYLPKEARLLSGSDTAYLKDHYLRGLDGYGEIGRFNTFFAEANALKSGEYGNLFYVAMDTNPWTKIYKVTVERRARAL